MKYLKLLFLLSFVLLFTACQKNTPYKLFYNPDVVVKKEEASVLIIPPSILTIQDSIIQNESKKIYDDLKLYLEENNFKVLDNHDEFVSNYKKELKKANGLFNPETGKFEKERHLKLINKALSKVSIESYDYVLIPTIVVKKVKISGINHFANWDGVRRKLHKEDEELVYPTTPLAASLNTVLLTNNNKTVLKNIVGLEILLEVKKANKFNNRETRIVRTETLFKNKKNLRESVSLSLDPFIPLK